jgi:hypothetical protein
MDQKQTPENAHNLVQKPTTSDDSVLKPIAKCEEEYGANTDPSWLKAAKLLRDIAKLAPDKFGNLGDILGPILSYINEYRNTTAVTEGMKIFDALGAEGISIALTKANPAFAAADKYLNLLDDTGALPGASRFTVGNNLNSSLRAIITLGEGLARGDVSELAAFQQQSIGGKTGIVIQRSSQIGQLLADSSFGQEATDYWAQNGFLGGLELAGEKAAQEIETGSQAALSILFPHGTPKAWGGALP